MRTLFFAFLLLLAGAGLLAQSDPFTPFVPKQAAAVGLERRITPDEAGYYRVANPTALATLLAKAPLRDAAAPGPSPQLVIPAPDGTKATFQLTRYRMVTPELEATFPGYVTAFGWDVAAPHRRVVVSWTALGFHASVSGGAEGRWYVDPLYWQQTDRYQSYFTRDYPQGEDRKETCGFVPDQDVLEEMAGLTPEKAVGDCRLREYRLALACTGEYFNAVGGTESLAIAEMMNAINRVNQVFMADLSLQLTIINLPTPSNGVQLVFNNPASDPYTNDDSFAMLTENQATVDAVIGTANYDIGHVFSTNGGGVASLRSPCSSTRKARGVTGLPNPTGDPFYIDFVAHEMGHQFGADHTFNAGGAPNCDNRNASTAYEPGSGTTVMAYAGICSAADNIQASSDAYYHAASIIEIANYMELGTGASCAVSSITTNSAPAIAPLGNFTIPANTPFFLTAAGSDPDGDALTYCWEQFDLGAARTGTPTGTATTGPLFRSRAPSPEPTRYFPDLADLAAGTVSPWEVLPRVTRGMTFIVTLRDFGAAGYGCPVQRETDISVVNTGSQYAVTAPNGGESWQAGNNVSITWNVAGTSAAPISCGTVDIVLSTDGGNTFDQVLATVPNNGSTTLVAPFVTTTSARIMVRCNGNIFFDISNANFRIEQEDYDFRPISSTVLACGGVTSIGGYQFALESLQGYTGTITYSASGLPGMANVTFTPTSRVLTANVTRTVDFTLGNLGSVAPGEYVFQVITTDDGGVTTKSEDFVLTVKPPLETPVLLSPLNNGFTDATATNFAWTFVPGATRYRVVLCRNASCTSNVVFITSNTSINGDITEFITNGSGPFPWFVIAEDQTCSPIAEAQSAPFLVTYGTAPPAGNSLSASGSPLEICEGGTAETTMQVNFFTGDLVGPASLAVQSAPPGLGVSLNPTTLNNGQSATVNLTGEASLSPGDYAIIVRATDGSGATEDLELTLRILEDAITFISPTQDPEEIEMEPNMSCAEGAIFLGFNILPYSGGGVATYRLLVSTNGFDFMPVTITPNVTNNRGYCATDGQVFTYVVEAQLVSGGTVRSCVRSFIARTTVLPVEWLSFVATPVGKAAQLNWEVVQDADHAGFTVERSLEGLSDWSALAYLPRSGSDGTAAYAYNDPSVAEGNTYVYRLRQEDVDGRLAYSALRVVSFLRSGEEIEAFPNPTTGLLTLAVGEGAPQELDYRVVNALGQEVRRGRIVERQPTISLEGLPPALYHLDINGAENYRRVLRIVKR